MSDVRIRVWDGYHDDYPSEADRTIEASFDKPVLWQNNPRFQHRGAFDIHPADTPATLYIHTNDSVREPFVGDDHFDEDEWGGAIERGLPFSESYEGERPFGCEVWGRILFHVEEGLTR